MARNAFDVFDFFEETDEDWNWDFGGGQQQQQQRGWKQGGDRQRGRWVSADWIEGPDNHTLKLDLPGVRKDQVRVNVEDDRTLVISGEKPKDRPDREKGEKCRVYERFGGSFSRVFKLPRNAKVQDIHARMEDGVLSLVVPKTAEVKPGSRPVEIQSGGHAQDVPATGVRKEESAGKMAEDPKVVSAV